MSHPGVPCCSATRSERVEEAVLRACRDGLSFGAATALEVEMAELMCVFQLRRFDKNNCNFVTSIPVTILTIL